MDETSGAASHASIRGNLLKKRKSGGEPVQYADRQKRRTCFAHALFICDNPRVQRKLPQLILGNEHILTNANDNAIVARRPANVYVKASKSAWMNAEMLKIFIDALAVRIRDELRQYMESCSSSMLLSVISTKVLLRNATTTISYWSSFLPG